MTLTQQWRLEPYQKRDLHLTSCESYRDLDYCQTISCHLYVSLNGTR